MVKLIGADYVIDYQNVNYKKVLREKFDIIYDAIGISSFKSCKHLLNSKGIFITVNPAIRISNLFKRNNDQFKVCNAKETSQTLNILREWIEAGKIKPVIDTIYPLAKVAEAHKHYETGRAKGRVVISID